MKITAVMAIALLAGILLACGSNSSMSSGGGSGSGGGGDVGFTLIDNWQITMNSSVHPGMTGSAGGLLRNNGQTNALSGVLGNIQPPCAPTANVNGTLNGKAITFSLNENGQSVAFTGTINDSIHAMTGTYSAPAGGCTNGDGGTWNAVRIPAVTGTWNGTLTPASATDPPFQISVPLTQDMTTGKVSGTAAVTGSPCFTTIPLSTPNFIAGQQLILTGQTTTVSTVQLTATLDLSGKSMSLAYTISGGSCDGQTGSGSLIKQ